MNNLKIPLYRGFSKTFNKYILGIPYFSDGRYYMLVDDCNKNNDIGTGSFPIDETTLSINFPDILDSQGNKIFASLSASGKGGSLVSMGNNCINKTLVYRYGQFWFTDFSNDQLNSSNFSQTAFNLHFTENFNKVNKLRNYLNEIKAVGIQK